MKRIVRKNQVIITALVIMIVVAGYLNFTAEKVTTTGTNAEGAISGTEITDLGNISEGTNEYADISDEDGLVDVNVPQEEDMAQVLETGDYIAEDEGEYEDLNNIGEAVLTSSPAAQSFCAAARLNREQTRSKNKETLNEIINNPNVAEDLKQNAINDLMNLTSISEKELAAETLLEAKGFANSVVSMNGDSVDVIICLESITESQKAQIEDIVMRKAEVTADKIVITPLKSE